MFVGSGVGVEVGIGVGVNVAPGGGVDVGLGVGVDDGFEVGVDDGCPGFRVGVAEGAMTIKVFLQAATEGSSGNSLVAFGFDSGTFGATGFVPRLFILITINTDKTAKTIVEIIIITVNFLFFIFISRLRLFL